MKYKYIGIDIGGTWIKGAVVDNFSLCGKSNGMAKDWDVKKVRSPLNEKAVISDVLETLETLVSLVDIGGGGIKGIGVSTPGIVDYHGTRLISAGPHLKVLMDGAWKTALEDRFQCPVHLINDADAAAIGLAELGCLNGNKTIGIMPIGTGLGFSIWRNGRRWRPAKALPLLGDISCANKSYNFISSASRLADLDESNDLSKVLSSQEFQTSREDYIQNLTSVIKTAAIVYSLDEVIVCGGLVDAAMDCGFALEDEMRAYLPNPFDVFNKAVHIKVATEGNRLHMIGNLTLARGESIAARDRVEYNYRDLETERSYQPGLHVEAMGSREIVKLLWRAEQEADGGLGKSLAVIATVIDESAPRISNGGRIIYVGAGTSGRIAALDAVEVPCTFGFPAERIVTLIAGGVSEAAMEIESDFEEDASAVPEMLLLNIRSNDVVIGISASGTAYYVQSALSFAKARGALSVMVQVKAPSQDVPFCDYLIPLFSGAEVIAGSTRMKAGTATKKTLNFFSTTLMITLGKVTGPYMTDVVCTNEKLVQRAIHILKEQFGIDEKEALDRLRKADMHLGAVVKTLR